MFNLFVSGTEKRTVKYVSEYVVSTVPINYVSIRIYVVTTTGISNQVNFLACVCMASSNNF